MALIYTLYVRRVVHVQGHSVIYRSRFSSSYDMVLVSALVIYISVRYVLIRKLHVWGVGW